MIVNIDSHPFIIMTYFKCPCCGYSTHPYDPKDKITELLRLRSPKVVELLMEAGHFIKQNIPTDKDINKRYYFLQKISKHPDTEIITSTNTYLLGKYYLEGKGFDYLAGIIRKHATNLKKLKENEIKKIGSIPKEK